jgi:hypothetical protein
MSESRDSISRIQQAVTSDQMGRNAIQCGTLRSVLNEPKIICRTDGRMRRLARRRTPMVTPLWCRTRFGAVALALRLVLNFLKNYSSKWLTSETAASFIIDRYTLARRYLSELESLFKL